MIPQGNFFSVFLGYCVCSSASSLCHACLGTTAPGTTGRKRSVLLLALAIVTSLWFQYVVGPSIVSQSGWIWKSYRAIPGSGKIIFDSWHGDCAKLYQDEPELLSQCAGNAGVFRPMFLAFIYFVVNAIVTRFIPHVNKEAWPAKYTLFFFGLLISMFVPSYPLFSGFFLWAARLGAAVFVIFQQIILVDVAYNVNDW